MHIYFHKKASNRTIMGLLSLMDSVQYVVSSYMLGYFSFNGVTLSWKSFIAFKGHILWEGHKLEISQNVVAFSGYVDFRALVLFRFFMDWINAVFQITFYYSIVKDSNADLTVGNWNSKKDP